MNQDCTHIILADDDADDRMFFLDAFDELKMNTKVATFKDGMYLMDFLNNHSQPVPHILFLDLNMPRKSGMICLQELRQNKRFDDVAIVIYSTSAAEEDIENTFVQGANVYIKKPNDFKVLKKVLSSIVAINWQYHTNGLNRDNFLLRM